VTGVVTYQVLTDFTTEVNFWPPANRGYTDRGRVEGGRRINFIGRSRASAAVAAFVDFLNAAWPVTHRKNDIDYRTRALYVPWSTNTIKRSSQKDILQGYYNFLEKVSIFTFIQ
jgi:hypothetical protein